MQFLSSMETNLIPGTNIRPYGFGAMVGAANWVNTVFTQFQLRAGLPRIAPTSMDLRIASHRIFEIFGSQTNLRAFTLLQGVVNGAKGLIIFGKHPRNEEDVMDLITQTIENNGNPRVWLDLIRLVGSAPAISFVRLLILAY